MVTRAGQLRHKAELQQPTAGSDASGQKNAAGFEKVADIRCSIKPLSGSELQSAQAFHSKVNYEIKMRYRAGVVAKMRLVFRGVIYNLEYQLEPELRQRELIWFASSGVNNG